MLLLSLASAQDSPWRLEVGADVQATSHGVLTVAWRQEDLSAGLYTDTLELRWSPEDEGGRAWLAGRVEVGAAGLMISPWTDGAPDPSRAMAAHYGGIEGGRLRYLPRGLYVGTAGSARVWAFTGGSPSLEPRLVLSPDLLVGWWSEPVHAWLRAGADVSPVVAPHLQLRVQARAPWRLAPFADLYLGVASNQDEVTLTRLGGLNPYVVPLAGAAWGEFWVEDHAVAHVGAGWHGERIEADLFSDLAAFDGARTAAFGALLALAHAPWSLELKGGVAPWIDRAPGVSPAAGWVLLSRGRR